jgi:hypothetical protein
LYQGILSRTEAQNDSDYSTSFFHNNSIFSYWFIFMGFLECFGLAKEKIVTSVDDRIYRPRTPVSNCLVISMWKGAKEAPVIFFAPSILLSRPDNQFKLLLLTKE